MSLSLRLAPLALAILLAFGASPEARAQGFGVYEHGTCAMARAGASVAKPCLDGSAMFYNPAGLAGHPGFTISTGATLIGAGGDFTDDRTRRKTDIQNSPIPVPHAYLAYGFNDRLSAGLGVYVPYGLGTEWPEDFDGRYLGYDNDLQSIYIQPTLAYQILDNVRLGAGLTITRGTVEINQRIDLADVTLPDALFQAAGQTPPSPAIDFSAFGVPAGTDFADAHLEGSAIDLGVHLGLLIDFNDRASLGARYLSAQTLEYEGEATFEAIPTGLVLAGGNPVGLPGGTSIDLLTAGQFGPNGLLRTQDIETQIQMPAQVVVGLALRPLDEVTVFLDYQWTGWSVFDRVVLRAEEAALQQVLEEDYEDTNGFRLGVEAVLGPTLVARAGYLYHEAAAPPQTVTPLLPEGARNEFTLGLGARVSPTITLDAAYQYIAQNDRRGRVADGPNTGLYRFDAHLFAVTASLRLR